jgi:hypothetical protein
MKSLRRRLRVRLPRVGAKTIENATLAAAFTSGLGLVTYGVWTVSHAAGLIVGGALLVTVAVLYELSSGDEQ